MHLAARDAPCAPDRRVGVCVRASTFSPPSLSRSLCVGWLMSCRLRPYLCVQPFRACASIASARLADPPLRHYQPRADRSAAAIATAAAASSAAAAAGTAGTAGRAAEGHSLGARSARVRRYAHAAACGAARLRRAHECNQRAKACGTRVQWSHLQRWQHVNPADATDAACGALRFVSHSGRGRGASPAADGHAEHPSARPFRERLGPADRPVLGLGLGSAARRRAAGGVRFAQRRARDGRRGCVGGSHAVAARDAGAAFGRAVGERRRCEGGGCWFSLRAALTS